MRVATGLNALLFLMLGCTGGTFADKDNASPKTSDAQAATDDDSDDSIALEPTAVGGAYLGCFVDAQLTPDLTGGQEPDEMPVGCQVFEDANFNRVKSNSGILVDSAELQILGIRKPLTLQPLAQHPRWRWVTRVPLGALHGNIFLEARRNADSVPVRVRVELLDYLPAAFVSGAAASLTGAYKLRVKGTLLCAVGNPIWSWDPVAKKPIVDPVQIHVCSDALRVRFSRFGEGFRIHVPNPKPLSCDTDNFAVEHCNDSCMDLEGFGIGNRFVLWACTKTMEAQSYTLTPSTNGAVRISGNGRPVTFFGGILIPDQGTPVEFEIIPVSP